MILENTSHYPVPAGGDTWSQSSFASMFGFNELVDGHMKVIKGKKYRFAQVTSAEGLISVVNIQKKAWKWSDRDLAPTHILALAADTGGGVFGAYDEVGEMVAFAAGFGGGMDTLTGYPAIISSMLAVAGDRYRSGGIGRELKIIQAYHANLQGYQVMKWFYDPERGENASLNMCKLGARAEEFFINKYGEMRSKLYGPVPTDRLRAVWRFSEAQVINRMLGIALPPTLEDVIKYPIATAESLPHNHSVLVQISGDIDNVEESEKIKRRFNLRSVLSHYFLDKNYIATQFISSGKGTNRLNYYLLEQQR